jgi:hypothetical protein
MNGDHAPRVHEPTAGNLDASRQGRPVYAGRRQFISMAATRPWPADDGLLVRLRLVGRIAVRPPEPTHRLLTVLDAVLATVFAPTR